jgi:hypothetical protein
MFDMDLLTSEHHFGSPGKVVLHIFNPINNMRKSYRIFTNRPLEEMFSHYRVHYCIYVPTFTYDGVLLNDLYSPTNYDMEDFNTIVVAFSAVLLPVYVLEIF